MIWQIVYYYVIQQLYFFSKISSKNITKNLHDVLLLGKILFFNIVNKTAVSWEILEQVSLPVYINQKLCPPLAIAY